MRGSITFSYRDKSVYATVFGKERDMDEQIRLMENELRKIRDTHSLDQGLTFRVSGQTIRYRLTRWHEEEIDER